MQIWHIKRKLQKFAFEHKFHLVENYTSGMEMLETLYQYFSSTDINNCTIVSQKEYKEGQPISASFIDNNTDFYKKLVSKKLLFDNKNHFYSLTKEYLIEKSNGTTTETEIFYGVYYKDEKIIEHLNQNGILFHGFHETIDDGNFAKFKKGTNLKEATKIIKKWNKSK
jgi:hypothetical protein